MLRKTGFLRALLWVTLWQASACSSADLDAPPVDAGATGLPTFGGNGRIIVDPFQDACASKTIKPERAPLDLIFMLDTSGSMADLAEGGSTKWSAVKSAFASFARSADSNGVSAAVHFFPMVQPGIPAECTSSTQCGVFGPCAFLKACVNAASGLPQCNTDADCAVGTGPCGPVGQCGASNLYCSPIGGRCSDKTGDSCKSIAGRCATREICDAPSYAMGASMVTALPAGAASLIKLLDAKTPEGMTPTGPALQGAIARARQHAMSDIGRRVAVVLATDGFPTNCEPRSMEAIAQAAAGGLMGSPSIPTFVVGVFADGEAALAQSNLTKIATAGGTPKPFIVSTSKNVANDFLAALNDIRATALACEYIIPKATTGEVDYEKVNLRFLTGSSTSVMIGNVASGESCHPTKGGWFYDVHQPPASLRWCTPAPQRVRASKAIHAAASTSWWDARQCRSSEGPANDHAALRGDLFDVALAGTNES